MGRIKIYNSLEEAKEAKKASDKERRKRNSEKIKEWNEFEKYGMIKQMRYVVEQMKKEKETENKNKKEDINDSELKLRAPSALEPRRGLNSDEEHSQ